MCPEGCAPQTRAPKQPPLAAIATCPAQGIPACVSPLIHGPWVAAHLVGHQIGQGVCSIIWPPDGNLGMLFPRENLHLSWASLPRGRPLLPVHCFKHLVGFRKREFRGRERHELERVFNIPSCLASQVHLQSQPSSLNKLGFPPSALLLLAIVLKDDLETMRRCDRRWGR